MAHETETPRPASRALTAWRTFAGDRAALISLVFLLLVILLAEQGGGTAQQGNPEKSRRESFGVCTRLNNDGIDNHHEIL